jgi:glycosyltransferase involved in cell wall biosynthesis
VYFYAKNNEGSRVICLIQENLKVNFFSKIILKNLPKNVHLIAITQSLCNKLKIYFPSISCLSNKFVNKDLYMGAKKYDLLYVGGEQKIKGFNLIKRITKSGSHNIKCIGFSNNYQTKLFEGYKENIIIHYQKAKILFCPITKYHFLRPAIEAGLVGVPFIITHLDGYTNVYGFDDFIYKGNNCETFKPKDKNSLTIAVKKILNNYEHYSVNARIVSGAFNKRWDIEISEFITKIK